jgi:flagellar biosynthesis GTPase FlhF
MKDNKNGFTIAGILAAGALLLAAGIGAIHAAQGGSDVLAKLSLEPAGAKDSVLNALSSGSVYHYEAAAAFKALPLSARAAVVRAGLEWVKSYAGTEEFKAAYRARREQNKPQPPAPRPAADEQTKKMKAEMEQGIAEMRKSMAAMDAETKKAMEASIQAMRAQIESMEQDPQQKEMMRQAQEMSVAEDKERHERQLREWEQRYPADVRQLIKKRIKDFLAMSARVDYAAKLTPRGERMVFANEAYEKKPPEWKLCFRAGREATEAARAFAQAWLAELEIK